MIVMIKITNVNMEVAAEKPVRKEMEKTTTCFSEKQGSLKTLVKPDVPCRGSPNTTCTNDGEEQEPEEAENGSGHHLVDGPRVDLLVQFGWQIGIVHVVSVREVF